MLGCTTQLDNVLWKRLQNMNCSLARRRYLKVNKRSFVTSARKGIYAKKNIYIAVQMQLKTITRLFSFDMSFKEIHIQSHDGEEKFMCTSCNRKFSTEVHLNMHLSAHNEPRQVSILFFAIYLND